MKETIAKMNKTKSWFLQKINKIDKPLTRLIKKKRERTQINKIRNERGEITMISQRFLKNHKRIPWKLYSNELDNQ